MLNNELWLTTTATATTETEFIFNMLFFIHDKFRIVNLFINLLVGFIPIGIFFISINRPYYWIFVYGFFCWFNDWEGVWKDKEACTFVHVSRRGNIIIIRLIGYGYW